MKIKSILIALLTIASVTSVNAQNPAPGAHANKFIVRAGDVLRIKVWPDNDLGLSGDFVVEETGLVHLPLVGPTRVGGVPIEELRNMLRTRYTESAVKNAVVTVTPMFKVSVLGAVRTPGLYAADPSQTVLDAVSLGGGFADLDRTKSVRLLRGGQTTEAPLRDELESGQRLLSTPLQSGDRIIVTMRNGFSFRDALPVLQTLAILVTLGIQLGK